MMRQCIHEDPFIGDGDQRCGKTFDDVDHSTICPHDELVKMTDEEIQAAYKAMIERDDDPV